LEKPVVCFICKTEFAPDSKKIGINDFVISKIPIPNGFAFSTKICINCFNSIKKDSATKTVQVEELEKAIAVEPPPQSRPQSDGTVIHFKNENIAILHKTAKDEEFISAFDVLTKEGYRLMSIETNSNSSSGAFFYFQRLA
jgi:hypothetical protein